MLAALASLVSTALGEDHFLSVYVLVTDVYGRLRVEGDATRLRFWLKITNFKNLPSDVPRIQTGDHLLGGNPANGFTALRADGAWWRLEWYEPKP